MAKQLGRWKCSTSMIGDEPDMRISLHPPYRTRDQAPPRQPAIRRGDQAPEGEPGALLCRLSQHGTSGEWHAELEDGTACHVMNGSGGLEIYAPKAVEGDARPFLAEAPPGAASLDQLRRRMAPRMAHDTSLTSVQEAGRLAAMQEYLNRFWAPR
jgi:hypothetical protein